MTHCVNKSMVMGSCLSFAKVVENGAKREHGGRREEDTENTGRNGLVLSSVYLCVFISAFLCVPSCFFSTVADDGKVATIPAHRKHLFAETVS